jgi:tetratricopeptide (TPR) repeat protein
MLTKNRSDYETYLNLSDKIIEHSSTIIDKNENDLDAQFYMGWTYTIRAFLVYNIDQNMLKAASDIKDGNKALTFVVEKNSSYYDAYLGLGIYNYMISMIPKKLQWLTSILGYSGDKEEGRKQLILASDKGTYTNTEAKFYLTLLSWREENYPAAEDYAKQLTSRHPQSPAIWMVWGLLLSQQDKTQEAIEAYNKALEFNKGKESEIVYKSCYGALSTSYFRMNDFEKAAEYGKKYMNYVSKDDKYNNRLYSIGASLELMGKRDEALNYYRQQRKDFTEDNEWEKYWYRRLNVRLERPLVYTDSLLITADNNRSIGKMDEAINNYKKLNELDQVFSDDINVQINSGMGQVYYKQKDYNKAIEEFKKNLALNPSEEKWLVPDSYFQIGRCYLRLGNKSEAKNWFDKAEDIDYDYDFKDAMDTKIKNELSKNG